MPKVSGPLGVGHHPTYVKALLCFGVPLVVCVSGVQGVLGRVPKQLVEALLGGLLLSAFLMHPVVARTRGAAGTWAARLALAWPLVVMLADASHPRTMWLFPLHKWHMFTSPMGAAPDPEQFRYTAHFKEGGSARLIPGAGVSDVATSALDGELKQLLTRTLRVPADPALRSEAARAIQGIARLQEAEDPAHSIRSVTVERCRLPVKPPYVADCAKVLEVEGASP